MNNVTKVMIADDHALFADGLEQIVLSLDGFAVVAKVTDGKLLMQKLNTVVPDMILMDINMPYLSGVEVAQQVLQQHPQVKVVFISMYYNAQLLSQAKELGAAGYLMKDVTASVLKEAIMGVRNGVQTFLAPVPTAASSGDEQQEADAYNLSPRELDIIQLIKEGMATKQIALELELSVYTVETHRKNINRKLKVQSAAELIALIHRLRI